MTIFRAENAPFVSQLLQSSAYQKQVAADLGATINSINGGQLVNFKFRTPETPEQNKISGCLSALAELIAAQRKKIDALKRHKKGLMEQLLSVSEEVLA
ncbi:restriction endonuclease subunit S [Janthinobacterium lividum]|nr:restriction endonuclease subunit S [Janthinobacterium lividum]